MFSAYGERRFRYRRLASFVGVVLGVTGVAPPIAFGAPRQLAVRPIPASAAPSSSGLGLKPGNETHTVVFAGSQLVLPLDLKGYKPGSIFLLTVAARTPEMLRNEAFFTVAVRDGDRTLVEKSLHNADPDLFTAIRVDDPRRIAFLELNGVTNGTTASFRVSLTPATSSQTGPVVIEAKPNGTWREAQPVPLGSTVIGTADDRPDILAPNQAEAESLAIGDSWFKVEQPSESPKLAMFNLEILDRDVSANILVFTAMDGKLTPYTDGVDPVSGPHEAQVSPTINQNGVELNSGNKFTTRVLKKGTYYLQVSARHPAYRLKMLVSDPPPFKDPRTAIRSAMDYIIAAGDSWLANTPRSGAVARRDRQPHAETALCVACHPTHFATRGELYAAHAGFDVHQRESLRFVSERLYNNPRPFYGPSGSSWVRVIGAAATVQTRMAQLLSEYEAITGEHRPSFYAPVASYIKNYYKRPAFQPDETEQNPPSISDFETGWMAWSLVDDMQRRGEATPDLKATRETIATLMSAGAGGRRLAATSEPAAPAIKNVDDLCFQTVALCALDRKRYDAKIAANVKRIFELQRPSGLWAYNFGSDQPECEFQTGGALYALACAGVPNSEPRVARAVTTLLAREKPFGAWNTDGQPYEAFNTPFKETQLVLMGLSALFPKDQRKGWTNGDQPRSLREDRTDHTLADLIAIWDRPSPKTLAQIRGLATSPNALVRLEAINALGRLADGDAVGLLANALGDDTLMVRRSAAQGLREIISRSNDKSVIESAISALESAMRSPRSIVRRAAIRAFAQHFRWLTGYDRLLSGVLQVAGHDSDSVARMEAAQALTMWWYWNDNLAARGRILDTVLASLGDERADERDLWAFRETLYNICDENIQYFYLFWTPLLPQESDRAAATAGFESVMKLQVEKIVGALKDATRFQNRQILTGLTEYPIARSWIIEDQVARNFLRIGNDLDAIDFRGDAGAELKPTVLSLLLSNDPFNRQRALVLSSYLRSNGGQPDLANAIARRMGDEIPAVRNLARQAHRLFPFNAEQAQFGADPRRFVDESHPNWNNQTLSIVSGLLDSRDPEVSTAGLRALSELGPRVETDQDALKKAKRLALGGDWQARAAAFGVGKYSETLRDDLTFQAAIGLALQSAPPASEARIAAIRLSMTSPLGLTKVVEPNLETVLQSKTPTDIADVLAVARADDGVRDDIRLVPTFENALANDSEQRVQALQLLKKSRLQAANPSLRVALEKVAATGTEAQKRLASDILSGRTGRVGDPEKLLDIEYFAAKVQPLLAIEGPDGRSCFNCHSNHTILNLQPPDATGAFSAEVTANNYRSALRVVNLEDPERSLLLRKPRSAGVLTPETGLSHVGGVRWASKDHPAYRAILSWLNGAHVKQGEALGKQPAN